MKVEAIGAAQSASIIIDITHNSPQTGQSRHCCNDQARCSRV